MLSKPRLLIFCDWFEPGYKAGGPVRSIVNLVKILENDLEIYIFTSDRDFNDSKPYPNVKLNQWMKYGQNTSVFYSSKKKLIISNIQKIIKDVNPNTIYLNSMWSINFSVLPLIIATLNKNIKICLAPRGMLHDGAIRFKPYKKKIFMLILRWLGILDDIHFHATDEKERHDIISRLSSENVTVISNFPSSIADKITPIKKEVGILKIVFISRISPKKNLLFIIDALATVNQNIQVEFSIFGPIEDKIYFENCFQAANKISNHIKINFFEPIEHLEINEKLLANHFFILPTMGENFGHAIFESFASGRPVLISDQTPWRDLEEKNVGYDLSLESYSIWVEVIVKCAYLGQSEFDIMCRDSYYFAQEHFQSSNLIDKYLKLFSK